MTIIFDLFGVLLSSSFASARDKLSLLLNRPADEIAPVYRQWETDFDLGRSDARQFWQHINADLGASVDWQELDNAVLDSIEPLPGSFALLESLHAYPLALLSNTRREWYEHLDARYHFSRYFTQVFLSFNMQLVKPDLRIYNEVMRQLLLPPQQMIYIDDSPQNITAAGSLGIPGILFENAQQTRLALNEWIFYHK